MYENNFIILKISHLSYGRAREQYSLIYVKCYYYPLRTPVWGCPKCKRSDGHFNKHHSICALLIQPLSLRHYV